MLASPWIHDHLNRMYGKWLSCCSDLIWKHMRTCCIMESYVFQPWEWFLEYGKYNLLSQAYFPSYVPVLLKLTFIYVFPTLYSFAGSYFHKDARFSNSYAKPDHSGLKRMFLARVLVGSYTRGNSEFRRPPPKDPRNPLENFYDSCVDDPNNPRLFVIFENNQVYPEYVITYRW